MGYEIASKRKCHPAKRLAKRLRYDNGYAADCEPSRPTDNGKCKTLERYLGVPPFA